MGSTLRQILQFPGGCHTSLGSHMAESTTLDINHQDPQRPTGLSDFKEECRKGGGRTAFSGVILDHCHACPEPPLESVLAKQGKTSSLEPLRGCGLWREARLQGPSPHDGRTLGGRTWSQYLARLFTPQSLHLLIWYPQREGNTANQSHHLDFRGILKLYNKGRVEEP